VPETGLPLFFYRGSLKKGNYFVLLERRSQAFYLTKEALWQPPQEAARSAVLFFI
jgi:hypothetical protein